MGLYYRSGYFRQSLTADGWQHETYPSLDLQGWPLRSPTPTGIQCWSRSPWETTPQPSDLGSRWVGSAVLLDSDIPENEHDLRNVTDRLLRWRPQPSHAKEIWPASAVRRFAYNFVVESSPRLRSST